MNCPKCNKELVLESGELFGLNHSQLIAVCAFNPDCDFGNHGTWQIFMRDKN